MYFVASQQLKSDFGRTNDDENTSKPVGSGSEEILESDDTAGDWEDGSTEGTYSELDEFMTSDDMTGEPDDFDEESDPEYPPRKRRKRSHTALERTNERLQGRENRNNPHCSRCRSKGVRACEGKPCRKCEEHNAMCTFLDEDSKVVVYHTGNAKAAIDDIVEKIGADCWQCSGRGKKCDHGKPCSNCTTANCHVLQKGGIEVVYRCREGRRVKYNSAVANSYKRKSGESSPHRRETYAPGFLGFSCKDCSRTFTRKQRYDDHRRAAHTGEKPYKCEICGKRFAKNRIKGHLRTHSTAKPFKCPHCPEAFKTNVGFAGHMRTHDEEGRWQCIHCGVAFPTKRLLGNHIQRKHRNTTLAAQEHDEVEDSAEPPVLGQEAERHDPYDHLSAFVAQTPLPVYCPNCFKLFQSDLHFSGHEHLCAKGHPWPCRSCFRRFTTETRLNRHESSHERGTLPRQKKESSCIFCNYQSCGLGFTCVSQVDYDSWLQTGQRCFTCRQEGCNARFTKVAEQTAHELSHIRIRCTVDACSRPFSDLSALRKHQEEDTAPTPAITASAFFLSERG